MALPEKQAQKDLSACGHAQADKKGGQVHPYERGIDQMVYKLYGLTDEEIALVKGSIKKS